MEQGSQNEFRYYFLVLLGLLFKTFNKTEENDRQHIAFQVGIKFFKHLASFYYLCNGTKIEKWSPVIESFKFFDHASINAIARATLECYLTFFGLFVDKKKSSKEKEFLILIWELRGELELQKIPAESLTLQNEKKKHLKEINALREKIKSHPTFLGLGKESQSKVLQGEWRIERTWKDLATDAGFSKKFFSMTYGRYSDSTHSGAWSSKESNISFTSEQQNTKEEIVMGALVTVIAKFIQNYWELFPRSKLSSTEISKEENFVLFLGIWLGEGLYN